MIQVQANNLWACRYIFPTDLFSNLHASKQKMFIWNKRIQSELLSLTALQFFFLRVVVKIVSCFHTLLCFALEYGEWPCSLQLKFGFINDRSLWTSISWYLSLFVKPKSNLHTIQQGNSLWYFFPQFLCPNSPFYNLVAYLTSLFKKH